MIGRSDDDKSEQGERNGAWVIKSSVFPTSLAIAT